jgi:LexA-binding, inner membrane-associated putative hydrolase
MILGHYGLALAAKRVSKRTSLGTLILAAQWADELWPFLLLAGAEQVRVAPGLMAANSLDFVSYPYTHSLVALGVWGLALGAIYVAVRRYVRGAWVVGALVVSHWALDLVVHRPDLPLWPDSSMKVGLGLWNSIAGTLVVEFGLLAIGVILYTRTTRPRDRIGRWGLWAMLAFLAAVLVSGLVSPPPPDPRTIAYSALALWLFVPWGYWIDRHRTVIE